MHKELFRNWRETRYDVDKKYPWGFLFSYMGTFPASFLCKFNVSANTVTIASLFCLLPAFILLPLYPLCGWSILQLWFLLDSTDGHIARFTSTTSEAGYFLDTFGAYLVYSFFFPFLGLSYSISIAYVGGCASLFYILTVLISQFQSSSLTRIERNSNVKNSKALFSRSAFLSISAFFVRFSALPFPLALISIITKSVDLYIYFYCSLSFLMLIYNFLKIYFEACKSDFS